MTDPHDDDKGGPRTETRRHWAYVALAAGGVPAVIVALVDISKDGALSEGHAALKDIFPPWLLAASLVLVLLKLIATFPEWSDPRSERYAPWFKFFADLAALAAAAYAALMAVFFASIPKIFGLLDTFVHQIIFVIIVVVVIAVLSVVFLKRRKILKAELQAGGAGEVPHP